MQMLIYISNRTWYNNMVYHCNVISHERLWWVLYFMFCASPFFYLFNQRNHFRPNCPNHHPTDHTYETARSMWPRKKIINREPNYNIWRSPRFIFKLGFNPQLQRPINNLTYKRMFLFFYNSLVAPKMHVFLRFAPGGGLISLASMITWYWSNQRLGVTWSEKLAYEWHLWRIYRQLAECWSLDVHYEFIYPESDFR